MRSKEKELSSDAVELIVMRLDAMLSEIGQRNLVETSKMIDELLDVRLMVKALTE